MEWRRGDFVVSDDRSRLDRAAVRRFIADESYWAAGISQGVMDKAIDNSPCFWMYRGDAQLGFARVVTDRATFGYLCDVFVEAAHDTRCPRALHAAWLPPDARPETLSRG